MTRDEFRSAAFLLGGGWPGEFTANDEDAYYFLLSDFEIAQIMQALKALRGSKFRPSASEIANVLTIERSDTPTFDEMVELVFGRRGVLNAQPPPRGLWVGDSRRVAMDACAAERLAELHPLIGSFVHQWTLGRLRRLDLESDWHRKELREGWATHCEAMKGRDLAAVAAGRTSGGLRRLNTGPVAALPTTTERGAE